MKSGKYLSGSIIMGLCLTAVFIFNFVLFPLVLSKTMDNTIDASGKTEAKAMPVISIEPKKKNTNVVVNKDYKKLSWTHLPQYEYLHKIPIERITNFKEIEVEITDLEPKIGKAILSQNEVMEIIKKRIYNVEDCNDFVYTIQLCKTEIPNIPYRYNIIVGQRKRVVELYESSETFATYYEVSKSKVALQGTVFLGEVNYIQINAITGQILMYMSKNI